MVFVFVVVFILWLLSFFFAIFFIYIKIKRTRPCVYARSRESRLKRACSRGQENLDRNVRVREVRGYAHKKKHHCYLSVKTFIFHGWLSVWPKHYRFRTSRRTILQGFSVKSSEDICAKAGQNVFNPLKKMPNIYI